MSDRPVSPIGSNATITSTNGLTNSGTIAAGGNMVRFVNGSSVDVFVAIAATAAATDTPVARSGGEVRIPKSDNATTVAVIPASTASVTLYAQSMLDNMNL